MMKKFNLDTIINVIYNSWFRVKVYHNHQHHCQILLITLKNIALIVKAIIIKIINCKNKIKY